MKSERKHNLLFWLLIGMALVSFLFVFFTRMHRIGVFDGDDWTYIGYARDALPNAKAWNPTRVFPEIFMPLVGAIAAFVVTPLTGDYLNAMTLTYAFVFSVCIAGYILIFSWSMKKSFHLENQQMVVCIALFLTAHFWIFRTGYEENSYLFLTRNLTCVFYYTIPTIWNAALVILFEEAPNIWKDSSMRNKGILVLAIYLAIYSNLFSSIVLVAYCGVVILQRIIWKAIREKGKAQLAVSIKQNAIYVGIIAIWLVSLLFEFKGGRAGSVGTAGGLTGVRNAASYLNSSLKNINKYFMIFTIGTVLLTIGSVVNRIIRKEDREEKKFLGKEVRFLLCAGVTALYQVLLCGVTSLSGYLSCADVQISIYFFLLAALFYAVCYVLKRFNVVEILLPLILCIAIFNCNTQGKTFQDSYQSGVPEKMATAMTKDLYEQILEADRIHLKEMNLYVPAFRNSADNWPMANYLGERMAQTLYKHGQISEPMNITVCLSQDKNELFGIGE